LTFVERIARQGWRVPGAGLHDWRRAIAARRRPVRRVPPPWAVNNPAQAPGPVKVSERFSQPAWCSSVIETRETVRPPSAVEGIDRRPPVPS